MISVERQRKNRPTYVELKSAINMGEKDRNIEKLGGSIKASIEKLKRLRTDILAESDIKRLTHMLAQYEKENNYYNELQVSLGEIDESSEVLERLKNMNKEFIENHKPEELQRKLDFMKSERSRMMHTDELIELDQASKDTPSGQILASDRHAIRNRILQQEQQELNEIERMVATIKRIATDTSRMILDQGMKLEIAASSMRNARDNLQTGRKELVQANQYQQDTNKKLFCFVCLIVVVVVVVLLITSSSKN